MKRDRTVNYDLKFCFVTSNHNSCNKTPISDAAPMPKPGSNVELNLLISTERTIQDLTQ